jgi:hypothetical protein
MCPSRGPWSPRRWAPLPPTSSASAGCTRAWARISVMPSHFCRPAPSRTSFAPASAGPEPAGLPGRGARYRMRSACES